LVLVETKWPYFEEKITEIAIYRTQVPGSSMSPAHSRNPSFFLMSSRTCSQIWLRLPVGDCQPAHFAKLFFKTPLPA
jgi:hypothetical protein